MLQAHVCLVDTTKYMYTYQTHSELFLVLLSPEFIPHHPTLQFESVTWKRYLRLELRWYLGFNPVPIYLGTSTKDELGLLYATEVQCQDKHRLLHCLSVISIS